MAKWRVYYKAFAETHIDVEAEDEAEAWNKAEEKFDSPQLCWHCSKEFDLSDFEPVEEDWGTVRVEDAS